LLLFLIFNDFSQTIISTATRPIVAKFAGTAELRLEIIGLKLDFAMATKLFLDFFAWLSLDQSGKFTRQFIRLICVLLAIPFSREQLAVSRKHAYGKGVMKS